MRSLLPLALLAGMLLAACTQAPTPSVADPATSTLAASASMAEASNDTVTVTVRLTGVDGKDLAIAGLPVTFTSNSGTLAPTGLSLSEAASTATVETDEHGAAHVDVTSPDPGVVRVTAHLGADASGPAIGEIDVEFTAVVLNEATVAYDGTAHALAAEFHPAAAQDGATYTYARSDDDTPLDGPPAIAGTYVVTATAGDGYPGTASATLIIEPRTLEVHAGATFADKVYDGSSVVKASAELDRSRVVGDDDVDLAADTRGRFERRVGGAWGESRSAGAYGADDDTRVVGALELAGADAANYRLTQPVGSANIAQKPLTLTGASADAKTFDGTTAASVSGTLDGLATATDEVDVEAAFTSAAAGKEVAVSVTLTGSDHGNYVLVDPSLTADVLPRDATITAQAQTKSYGAPHDLGTAAFEVDGLVDGDAVASVTLSSPGATHDADAGTYAISPADPVADAGTRLANYHFTYDDGDLEVVPVTLDVTPASGLSKVYGKADPTLDFGFPSTSLVGDDTVVGAIAREVGEDVGRYAYTVGTLTVNDGNDGANYDLRIVGDATFVVEPAPSLVVTPDAGQSKIYGDADPDLSYSVTDGELSGDDALTGALGREPGEDAGTYVYTLGSLAIQDGNDGANYTLELGGGSDFTVKPRTVTIGGTFTVSDRIYDGTVGAPVDVDELTLENVADGDELGVDPEAEYADRFVGDGKTATLTAGTALTGVAAAAGNYVLDLKAAPTATGNVTKAPITFDVSNKDSLVYDGSKALPLVVTTDPDAVPHYETVGYYVEIRRTLTNAGETVDEGVTAIRDAGAYAVTVTADDPRYEGQDTVTVTVAPRALTLTAAADGKTYGDVDPDLTATIVDGEGRLGQGDALEGALAYTGTNAGTYPFELGAAKLVRKGHDVSGNYALTVDGTFTIAPAPVSFDVVNADRTVDGVHVFQRDGSEQVGLDIHSDPAGITDYRLAYRRTHDANHASIPPREQAVHTIEQLGTYVVTIDVTNPNYIGTSQRTVWLTDATALGFRTSSATSAHVDQSAPVTVGLVGADGEPRSAGPLPVQVGLSVSPSTLAYLAAGHVVTGTTIAAGASAATVDAQPEAADTYTLTADVEGPLSGFLTPGTHTFLGTLPPIEALLFTDANELDAFTASDYTPPTFKDVFDTWPRISGSTYYTEGPYSGSADNWAYLEDDVTSDGIGDPRVVQPDNVSPPEGFVSPEADALAYYDFEATLYSDNGDNDSIGLIIAFVRDDGVNKYLVAQRSHSGTGPQQGWGITYHEGSSTGSVLAQASVGATGTGWTGQTSRVKIERQGDVVRTWATPWNDGVNFQSEFVIDFAANTIDGNSVAPDLSVFRGERQYGYFTYSQPNSTYLDIVLEGGVALDTAILLTGATGSNAWTASEVWRFANGDWSLDGGHSIQDELGFPRRVTSVAPHPAPDGDPIGTVFQVLETEVHEVIE